MHIGILIEVLIMKKVQLIHKEADEECFEILKFSIVEDQQAKKYQIDKDTLLQNLPESVINQFLDFLGVGLHRELMLHLIKKGSLIITCTDD